MREVVLAYQHVSRKLPFDRQRPDHRQRERSLTVEHFRGAWLRAEQCRQILTLVLAFAERNPGFMRLLSGDVLQGETARLRSRVRELFDRLEAEIRQVLRNAESPGRLAPTNAANLLLAYAEGRIAQFVRSDFTAQPTEQFRHHWPALRVAVFN